MREITPSDPTLPDGMFLIYVLADPDTGDVRYVGQTKTPRRRLWLHRSASNNRSSRRLPSWIRRLLAQGKRPLMLEVELTTEPNAAEVRWIAEYKRRGADLLNMNEGGQTLEHCLRAPTAIRKGTRQGIAHRVMIDLKRGVNELNRLGYPDAAQRVEAKRQAAQAAINRLAKRIGRAKAMAHINEKLALKYDGRTSKRKA